MITYAPRTPLESAVLESGRFEFSTDTAGREVIQIGHRRLPRVVLPQATEELHGLVDALSAGDCTAFSAERGEQWSITEDEPDPEPIVGADEYLVMTLRPMKSDGRPIRVSRGSEVVRLFLLPWTMPARTIDFGHLRHYLVTSTKGVIGDWTPVPDGTRGVVVGLPEIWVGILERQCPRDSSITFRCDVPVPWVSESGLSNSAPSTVGIFGTADDEKGSADDGQGTADDESGNDSGRGSGDNRLTHDRWLATVPILMTEGNVVHPVLVPMGLEAEDVPAGPWELEFDTMSGFSLESLR